MCANPLKYCVKLWKGKMGRWIYPFSSSLFSSSSQTLTARKAGISFALVNRSTLNNEDLVSTNMPAVPAWKIIVCLLWSLSGQCGVPQAHEKLDLCSHYFLGRCLEKRGLGLWQTFIAVLFAAAIVLQGPGSRCQEHGVPKWKWDGLH